MCAAIITTVNKYKTILYTNNKNIFCTKWGQRPYIVEVENV